MWVKLDDQFINHPKVFAAAEHLKGRHARGRAIAIFVAAVSYANSHLTDGFIADSAIRDFTLDDEPARVARVLAQRDVRLFERVRGGYRIHDYHDHNPKASEVKAKLKRDRDRKRAEAAAKANGRGGEPAHAQAAPLLELSARNPDGIGSPSARIPRASRARDPIPIDQYVHIQRSPRLRRGTPANRPRVLKALVWAEVMAAFADPAAERDVPSLTERCKVVAARAGLVYAVDEFFTAIEVAINRARASADAAILERRRA